MRLRHRAPLPSLLCAAFFAAVIACATGETTRQGQGGDDGGSADAASAADTGKKLRTCSGTPSACKALSDEACSESGCDWSPPTCIGVASDCGVMSKALCDRVPGCSVNQYGYCTGSPVACDERDIVGGCDDVLGKSGCELGDGKCSGTPQACSTYSPSDCADHAGCALTE